MKLLDDMNAEYETRVAHYIKQLKDDENLASHVSLQFDIDYESASLLVEKLTK